MAYLPMPLTGARRIESERVEYRDLQRRHHAEHPDYARGWRRASDTTATRVLELISTDPEAAQLRAHVVRPRTPSERTQRRELRRLAVSQRALVTVPITPEQTLAAAGIDDARQAEYQRKMSALLASRS